MKPKRIVAGKRRQQGSFEQLTRESLEASLDPFRRIEQMRQKSGAVAKPTFRCARCEDTGVVYLEDATTVGAADLAGRPDPARPGKRTEIAVTVCPCRVRPTDARIPLHLRQADLSNYRETTGNQRAIQAVRDWLAKTSADRSDLFFCGPPGVGKTRLAVTALNEACARGARGGLFAYVPALIQLQQQGFGDTAKRMEANALLDACRRADPLILDGLADGEKGSDYSRGILLILCEERINANRRTIWTSNLDLDQLVEFYGDDRFPSRIAGNLEEIFEIEGDDQRLPLMAVVSKPAAKGRRQAVR